MGWLVLLSSLAVALPQAAPVVPSAPVDREEAVRTASAWLVAHEDQAFRADDPIAGVLPGLMALALGSAGERAAFQEVQARLEKKVSRVGSTPGRALAIAALCMDPSSMSGEWKKRGAAINTLLNELLQSQDLREWSVRRSFWGSRMKAKRPNPSYGGFGLNLASAKRIEFDGRANVVSLALAAFAVRAAERLGFELQVRQGNTLVPGGETWLAIAHHVTAIQRPDGAIPWETGRVDSDFGATALGLFALALAEPPAAFSQDDPAGTQALLEQTATTRADALAWLRGVDPASPPRDDLSALVAAAAESLLSWNLTQPDLLPVPSFPWNLRQADGGFDAKFDLSGARLPDEETAFLLEDEPRRLLATSLALLALTGGVRRFDFWIEHCTLRELTPDRLAKVDGVASRRYARLVAMDGLASLVALGDDLRNDPRHWPEPFPGDVWQERLGWDFGVAAGGAGGAGSFERVQARFDRWLAIELGREHLVSPATTSLGHCLRALIGDETPLELAGLVTCFRKTADAGAVDDIVSAIAGPHAREQAAARALLLALDLPELPEARTAEERARIGALVGEMLRRHLKIPAKDLGSSAKELKGR